MEIRKIGSGEGYMVTSERDPEKRYTVLLLPERESCTCPSYTYRSGPCKHILAVKESRKPKLMAESEEFKVYSDGSFTGPSEYVEWMKKSVQEQAKVLALMMPEDTNIYGLLAVTLQRGYEAWMGVGIGGTIEALNGRSRDHNRSHSPVQIGGVVREIISVHAYMCSMCWEIDYEPSPEPLYECTECDVRFTRKDSADGMSHRCPECNRFSSKVAGNFCPKCEEGEMDELEAFQCPHCLNLHMEEEDALTCCRETSMR